ncbi:ATP synthase F0 subunit B, partial [Faecalibacterium wellingii]|uniref:ATP synthase F0 subunit B n=1 Tax=Faecalibacterium wellingii TaxID=2929491 RepID=UPI003ED8AA26
RTEAEAMKAEYEQNLQNARAEANEIVANAQKTATARGEEIVGGGRLLRIGNDLVGLGAGILQVLLVPRLHGLGLGARLGGLGD